MRVSLPFVLIVVGGLVVAALGAALVVVGGSKDDDAPLTVVAATVVVPTAAPTSTPAPTATPVPPPPPEPAAVPDRTDCAAIRADPTYRSENERLWFIANCSAPSAPAQSSASAPASSAASQPPASAPPAPVPTGPRTVTVSLCDGANRGILLFTITSGSFSYRYDATPSGLNIQPADLVSSLSIPNVPPGTYSYSANILSRNGGLLQSYNRSSDQDRIVSSPFC